MRKAGFEIINTIKEWKTSEFKLDSPGIINAWVFARESKKKSSEGSSFSLEDK